MNIKKTTLLLLTLFIVLTTVSAISATSDDSSSISDDTESTSVDTATVGSTSDDSSSSSSDSSSSSVTTTTSTFKSVDTQKTTTSSSSSDEVSLDSSSSSSDKVSLDSSSSSSTEVSTDTSSQSTTTKVSSETTTTNSTESQNIVNDNSGKNTENNVINNDKSLKTDGVTHVVTSENLGEYFDLIDQEGPLTELVLEGDTLDFQGTINLTNQSLTINKPVNVTSTTGDSLICLNTVSGSLLGDDPGACFVVNRGGSYSNISNINLYNSQLWIYNTTQVVFDNISAVVEDARIGGGVGQTSIREGSTYVTIKNSYIYTKNNGGSSSFVIAGASYCTLDNCTIESEGNVGNLIYITTYNIETPLEGLNSYNNITNNHVISSSGDSEVSYIVILSGNGTYLANNTFESTGLGLSQQTASGTCYDTVIENNVWVLNSSVSGISNSIFRNNTFGVFSTAGVNVTVENNTMTAAKISNNNTVFEDNVINGLVNITSSYNSFTNNTVNSYNPYSLNITGSYNNITDNYLTARTTAGENSIVNTGSENIIENNTPVSDGKSYIITDDTYLYFFNNDGTIIEDAITSYSNVTLQGTFYNRNFTITDKVLNISGDDAVLKGSVFNVTDTGRIQLQNIEIDNTGYDLNNAITFATGGNYVENVTIKYNGTNEFRAIILTGDQNIINKTNISIDAIAGDVDYSTSPSIAPTIGIGVLSSSNKISNCTIDLYALSSKGDYPTTDGITIQGSVDSSGINYASNNSVSYTRINMQTVGYAYAINMGDYAYNSVANYNNITAESTTASYGIQVSGTESYGITAGYSNIDVTADDVTYGITLGSWSNGNDVSITARNNNITAKSDQVYLIEAYTGSFGSTFNSNRLIGEGTYVIGVGVTNATDMTIQNNYMEIKGKTNSTLESSYDAIKPTTAGIIVFNSEDVILQASTAAYLNIIVNNGVGIKLVNITNGNITTINVTCDNSDAIILENCNNITFRSANATTPYYAVTLTNSSDINITSYSASNVGLYNSTENEYAVKLVNTTDSYIKNTTIMGTKYKGDYSVELIDSENIVIELNRPWTVEISIDADTIYAYNESTINLTITNSTGTTITGNGTAIITIDGESITTTVSNGKAIFTYKPMNYGVFDVEIEFISSSVNIYNDAILTTQITVEENPHPILVEIEPMEVTSDGTIELKADIVAFGSAADTGNVIFKINGKTLKDEGGNVIYVNVTDGVASYNYTLPVTNSNTYTISAVYTGEGGVARSENTTITVPPKTASIQLTTDGTLMPGQNVTFTAYITDANNNAVTRGKVVFKLNGVSLKDEFGNVLYAYVDENGIATLNYTIPDNFSAKDYTLTAVFQGAGYERTETNDTITITKIDTTVSVDSSIIDTTTNTITITQGENLQLKATIIDQSTANAVTGTTKVAVKINNKTVVQQYVTDGVIDLTIYTSSFKNPTYSIEIIAGENSQYNKSSYNGTLSVLEPNSLLINETSNNGTLLVIKD